MRCWIHILIIPFSSFLHRYMSFSCNSINRIESPYGVSSFGINELANNHYGSARSVRFLLQSFRRMLLVLIIFGSKWGIYTI
jgi:hypothetical protein